MSKSACTKYWEEILTSRGWSTDRYSTLHHFYIPYDINNIYQQRRIESYEKGYHSVILEINDKYNNNQVKYDISIENLYQLLHKDGIDPNAHDRNGYSLLHRACRLGSIRAVRMLLEAGAWPFLTDSEGKTPLHEAAWLGQHDLSIPRMLLDWNSSILNGTDRLGFTPLDYVPAAYTSSWKQLMKARQDIWWPISGSSNIKFTIPTSPVSATKSIPSTSTDVVRAPHEWGIAMRKVLNGDIILHECSTNNTHESLSQNLKLSSTTTPTSPNNTHNCKKDKAPVISSRCCGDPVAKSIVTHLRTEWDKDNIGTASSSSLSSSKALSILSSSSFSSSSSISSSPKSLPTTYNEPYRR